MHSFPRLVVFLQLLAITVAQPYVNGELDFSMDEMYEMLDQHNYFRAVTEPLAANMMAIVSYNIITSMK